MIKKDIVYTFDDCEQEKKEEMQSSSVDMIFMEADSKMNAKRNTLNFNNDKEAKKKKRRKRRFLRSVLSFMFWTTLVFGILAALAIYSFKAVYPTIKENILYEMSEFQNELMELDDSTLTVDEYYRKQILLLFTKEDLELALDNIGDFETLIGVLVHGDALDISMLSQEKLDEYYRLLNEYERAKKTAETNMGSEIGQIDSANRVLIEENN